MVLVATVVGRFVMKSGVDGQVQRQSSLIFLGRKKEKSDSTRGAWFPSNTESHDSLATLMYI